MKKTDAILPSQFSVVVDQDAEPMDRDQALLIFARKVVARRQARAAAEKKPPESEDEKP